MPLIRFISNSMLFPSNHAIQYSDLALLAFLRTKDVRGDLEFCQELSSKPLQFLRIACCFEIVSVNRQRDVTSWMAEVAGATFPDFEPNTDEEVGVCLRPVLGCVTRPIES
jgi:hypothetical protein